MIILHTAVPIEKQVTFNCAMSEEEFFKWLKARGVSERDCKTLSGTLCYMVIVYLLLSNIFNTDGGVTASGFILLEAGDFDELGLTLIGKKHVLRTLKELTSK